VRIFSAYIRRIILFYFRRSSGVASALVDNFWSKLKKVNVFASKTLTADDLRAGVDTMREHLIAKNVASDVAEKICESISTKLAGKTLGSFESLTSNIRQAMRETLMMILTPKRRIDILRDVVDAQKARRPYSITFCGVNGVGKSTNLAKVISIVYLSFIRIHLGRLLAEWK
jgi:signal recognition particle GTPase